MNTFPFGRRRSMFENANVVPAQNANFSTNKITAKLIRHSDIRVDELRRGALAKEYCSKHWIYLLFALVYAYT